MIQFKYACTKKRFKTTYIKAMTVYYMKIYAVAFVVGIVLINALGIAMNNEALQRSGLEMFYSFPILMLMCLILSVVLSYFEAKKCIKEQPEMMDGTIKMKFEKTFFMINKDGRNTKFHYSAFRGYRGLNGSMVLYQPKGKSFVIPAGLITNKESKQIKGYTKG